MTDNQPTKTHNDRNVYILGAGFSAEAGLPLIKDFMNRMRDAAAWLTEQGEREREVKAIERVLAFRLRAAAAAYRVPLDIENVEELFSLASASARQGLGEDMALAIAATLDFSRTTVPRLEEHQYFNLGVLNVPDWTKPPNWRPPIANIQQGVESEQLKGHWFGCPPYEFYLGAMCSYFNKGGSDRSDTIITFNYDTVVEDALEALEIAFSYGADEYIGWTTPEALRRAQRGPSICVLKLHGSVNWCDGARHWAGTESKLAEVPHGIVTRMNRKIVAFPDYASLRKQGHIPLLVAPTWQKALAEHLSAIWDDSVAALRTATRVIILGYSIPPTDQHFRYLLAAGLQDNISLRKIFFVNPALGKEEIKTQLQDRLMGLFRREHFERGIIEPVPTDIRDFLGGPRNIGEGSYRVRFGRALNPPGYTWGTAPWTFYPPFLSGWTIA